MIPENMTLNQNQIADCLKPISNIGHTIYQNVCNGTSTQVPWGVGDWFLALLIIVIIGFLGKIAIAIKNDY